MSTIRKIVVVASCVSLLSSAALAQASADAGVVHGGQILADVVAWGGTAFGAALAAVATAGVYKFMQWMGIQVTDGQKAQLQSIIVNGLNAAGAKAQVSLTDNPNLDISVKNQIIQDAVSYAQSHASETIKALGLDPESGEAVEAIRARIATALNDPATPTPLAITPAAGQPK